MSDPSSRHRRSLCVPLAAVSVRHSLFDIHCSSSFSSQVCGAARVILDDLTGGRLRVVFTRLYSRRETLDERRFLDSGSQRIPSIYLRSHMLWNTPLDAFTLRTQGMKTKAGLMLHLQLVIPKFLLDCAGHSEFLFFLLWSHAGQTVLFPPLTTRQV